MINISSQNFCVARVETRTRASVTKFERHIERKNESYENMNVDLSRSHLNISYKSCGEQTYIEYLDELIANNKVSLRGLKPDATIFDEMILDVNTEFFELNGGYEYAKQFYEDAFHFAEKIYGKENIISAVMHADEQNIAMSEKYGKPVYHYHLHIMALPIVEKEIRWSKRCKNKELIGTIKEVVNQISHSKKWHSAKALDENGNPILNARGKPVYHSSYSILQDEFYEYMTNAGYKGFVRGERGSTEEHLTVTQFKVEKEKQRLESLEEKIEHTKSDLKDLTSQIKIRKVITKSIDEIESMGKTTFFGKVELTKDESTYLKERAKLSVMQESQIINLKERIESVKRDAEIWKQRYQTLLEQTKDFITALKLAPQKVKDFLEDIIRKAKEQEAKLALERREKALQQAAIRRTRPKKNKNIDYER